jgi:LuxR family maltose regulon positive regulatory protein
MPVSSHRSKIIASARELPVRGPSPATRTPGQPAYHECRYRLINVGDEGAQAAAEVGSVRRIATNQRRTDIGDVTIPVEQRSPILTFGVSESKFHALPARPGIVARTALVDRLATAREQVVSVVAPPGYGKTTLLAEWAERLSPRVAWVSCDDGDNDPVVLLTELAFALNRIEPIDLAIFGALTTSGSGITFVRRFVSAIAAISLPVAVVLDNTEAVRNKACRDVIAELAVRLPAGWRFALASRANSPLPTARLRAQGAIIEIGARDLAMDHAEALSLLKDAGLRPGTVGTSDLLELTEGWAAGLYLAALAINAGVRQGDLRAGFMGDDRFIGDYLRSELLDQLSDTEVTFLTRTSILDRMSGPLCDAILEQERSAQFLEELEGRNLLVVPLDRRREWYRYHHLLREFLQAELRRREPKLVPGLHSRAAAWHEANGASEVAIEHARRANDLDRQARLVLELANPVWASGRVETVLLWIEGLRGKMSTRHYGAIAVHGALIFALLGQASEAEQWAAAAERAPTDGILPDGNTMRGTLAYLRALLVRDGVDQMRLDAQLAWDELDPASPYRASMLHCEGLAYLLENDGDGADAIFSHAFDLADNSGALPFAAMVLAERCIVAAERNDWDRVASFTQRAVEIVEKGGFEDYWTSALVYAWATRAALHDGDIAATRHYLARAVRLRPLLTYALPVVSVQTLLELARCYIALADTGGAAAVLGQIHDIMQQRPDLGTLSEIAQELQGQVTKINQVATGASSLTAAELRLLPLLATHLSFREIAERFLVSFHTIKSQAYSIYQKLGVSSRSQAVARAHELGLDPS